MSATTTVVVDASVAAKWVLKEQGAAEARLLLKAWLSSGVQPIAPSWFACEVANIVYRRARGGEITMAAAERAMRTVLGIVVLRDTPGSDAVRAIEIADATRQQTPYDACYLALAEREGCEYWTDDARFVNAAGALFPQVKYFGAT